MQPKPLSCANKAAFSLLFSQPTETLTFPKFPQEAPHPLSIQGPPISITWDKEKKKALQLSKQVVILSQAYTDIVPYLYWIVELYVCPCMYLDLPISEEGVHWLLRHMYVLRMV